MFNVQVYDRGYATELTPPMVRFKPARLIWAAIGGPDEATLSVSGARSELSELIEKLRCPIEIIAVGRVIWSGYIESVSLEVGKIAITVSIEDMYNRICLTYGEINTAGTTGERKETAWYEDADSVAVYGTKEKRISLNQATEEEAINRIQTDLARWKYPIASHEPIDGDNGTVSGIVTCRGWWHTLDWKYYANSAGKESYEEIGTGLQSVGDASSRMKLAQSITISSGVTWLANSIKLRMRRNENPTDNLVVSLCADASGAPGTVLASASLAGTDVDEDLNWHELMLGSKVTVVPGATYWIVVERSGAANGTNYYKIDANEDLEYAGGVLRLWNGSAWVARDPDADMLFQLGGVEETTTQLNQILNDGQFFTSIYDPVASGVYSSPWRDGDSTGQMCVEELMKSGTTNLRRLLATVDMQRVVRVSEEPVAGSDDYYLMSNGKLLDTLQRPLANWQWPVGVWAQLADLLPGSVDTSKIADPSRVFLERVIYNVEDDTVDWEERDYHDLME